MSLSIGVSLQEYTTRCILGGISGNGKGFRGVGQVKDGFGQEAILQPIKDILAGIVPVPWGVFLG